MLKFTLLLLILNWGCVSPAPSALSEHISYDYKDFVSEQRVVYGYTSKIGAPSLVQSGALAGDVEPLTLELVVPAMLLDSGRLLRNGNALVLTAAPGSDSKSVKVVGTVEEINQVLKALVFERSSKTYEERKVTFIYKFTTNHGRSEQIRQVIHLPIQLQIEVVNRVSTFYINAKTDFALELLSIKEDFEIVSNQEIRVQSTSSSEPFYTFSLSGSMVILQGRTPEGFKSYGQSEQSTMNIIYSIRDKKTGDESRSFAVYIDLDASKSGGKDQLKLILMGSFILLFLIILIVCMYIIIRRENKLNQEQVQKAIQEEQVPQENILTRSILEWNKDFPSTSDQTSSKESTLYNPYDKYALKKKESGKRDRDYTNIKQSPTSGLNDTDRTSQKGEEELKGESSRGGFELGSAKKMRPNFSGKNGAGDRNKHAPEINLSQLEFSKIDDMHDEKRLKDHNFGDFSKIGDHNTILEEYNGGKDPADANLKLEDIILNDL
jgi:hypothetical protein